MIQFSFRSRTMLLAATTLALGATACTKRAVPTAVAPSGTGQPIAAAAETIKIGEVGSMTGEDATFGESSHQGVELAVKEINAAGGLKGKQVELILMDDQGKPEEAATSVTKLITQNKVSAILGEVASGRSLAMAPIAQAYKVPMITPSSVDSRITEQGDQIFRVCFNTPFHAGGLMRFATEHLKAKKAAILRDVKNDYSVSMSDTFAAGFKKAGGEIVIDQVYSAGDVDFKSQLTAIRAKKPDVIFLPGYYTAVGLIARQAKELGIEVPLIGGDGWDSPKLLEIGGPALNGSYFTTHFSAEDQAPLVQAFISKYKAAYNRAPDAIAALGYDAMQVLAEAIRKSATGASGEIRDQLAKTQDFAGVTGKITIDQNRNPVKSAVVLKIEDGKIKYQRTIAP